MCSPGVKKVNKPVHLLRYNKIPAKRCASFEEKNSQEYDPISDFSGKQQHKALLKSNCAHWLL